MQKAEAEHQHCNVLPPRIHGGHLNEAGRRPFFWLVLLGHTTATHQHHATRLVPPYFQYTTSILASRLLLCWHSGVTSLAMNNNL